MINYHDIRYRLSCIKESKNGIANLSAIQENAVKYNSFEYLKTAVTNWDSGYNNQVLALENTIKTINAYFIKNESTSQFNTIMDIFNVDVIPHIRNIKECKGIIKEFTSKYNDHSTMENVNNVIAIDRVVSNHERLNKYSNFDNYINESCIGGDIDSLEECVNGLCNKINSYKMSFDKKFNVALENVAYGLSKNNIPYDKSIVLEFVVDYFTRKDLSYDDIVSMRNILENTVVYSENDKRCVSYATMYERTNIYHEGKLVDKLSSAKILKALKGFQMEKKKSPSLLNSILAKVYTNSSSNILEETPNFLSWFRRFLVFSTFAINPFLGVFNMIVDSGIKLHLQRKETEKMINQFKSEKSKVEKKMNKCNDSEKKARYKEYLKGVDESIEKLEDYYDGLFTEKENDKRKGYDESFDYFENVISVDEYFDKYHAEVTKEVFNIYDVIAKRASVYLKMDDIQDVRDFGFANPNNICNYLNANGELMIKVADWMGIYNKRELSKTISNEDDIIRTMQDTITKLCANISNEIPEDFSIVFDGNSDLYHIYIYVNVVIESEVMGIDEATVDDICSLVLLDENMNTAISNKLDLNKIPVEENAMQIINSFLEASNIIDKESIINEYTSLKKSIIKSDNKDKYRLTSTLESCIYKLKKCKNDKYIDFVKEFAEYNYMISLINENKLNAAKNNVKVAAINAKKSAQKMSDKDKVISHQLDSAFDRMRDKIQRNLTNKNREAVIKGTVIPSLSSIIKLALGAATLSAVVSPALAAISLVGGIALSKRATDKERQYILDEIDIELKLVDKKIQLAESNNDMKSLEQLLKIQQRLRREKQRITYKGRARNYQRDID